MKSTSHLRLPKRQSLGDLETRNHFTMTGNPPNAPLVNNYYSQTPVSCRSFNQKNKYIKWQNDFKKKHVIKELFTQKLPKLLLRSGFKEIHKYAL